jgi:cobalt-zinc-cadmium efflux system outer membrane protein
MQFCPGRKVPACLVICLGLILNYSVSAQQPIEQKIPSTLASGTNTEFPAHPVEVDAARVPHGRSLSPFVARYFDPQSGISFDELARRALSGNGELIAARIEVERARARLRQAGLRPNPTLDFERTTGRLTGSKGESETSIGVSVPIELGQRGRRLDLAEIELRATEADIAERERRLMLELRTTYAEALIALRELEITENLNNLDLQLVRFVQARVNEGDTAPIELNLLQVEVDRLRSRRALAEGRLQVALLQLRTLAGLGPTDPLRLREELAKVVLQTPPASLETLLGITLRTLPGLRMALLTEEIAAAGLRLIKAQTRPDVTVFGRYTVGRAVFDDTPVGPLFDRDKSISYGVSIGLPVFNRNQGARADAALAITQAKTRREFLEAQIRSQVTGAYLRYEAAQRALAVFETGVIARSEGNVQIIRAAYELGEFRLTDLINEQRRLVDSQREFTDAMSEQYRALADLQAAIGVPVIK